MSLLPQSRKCSFCGSSIEPGTGKMYVLKSGRIFYFCSGKCQRNMINLGRLAREVKWTEEYRRYKAVRMESSEETEKNE